MSGKSKMNLIKFLEKGRGFVELLVMSKSKELCNDEFFKTWDIFCLKFSQILIQ